LYSKAEIEEKKRQNLAVLYDEIREARARAPKKSKSKKSKKGSKQPWTLSKQAEGPSEGHGQYENGISIRESDDENYSILYNEYKKIIKGKQLGRGSNEKSRKTLTNQITSPSAAEFNHLTPEQAVIEARKEEVKKKFFEISNRYQKNLMNSIHSLENTLSKDARMQEYNHDNMEEQPEEQQEEAENEQDQEEYQQEYQEGYEEGLDPEMEDYEQQYLEIIESAALFIQKNWRGYFVRKRLREYFAAVEAEGYEEEGYPEDEYPEEERYPEGEEEEKGKNYDIRDPRFEYQGDPRDRYDGGDERQGIKEL
jgi:hypothetical protein